MKRSYDLKKLKWVSNPYVKKLKRSVTIRIDQDVLEYFQRLSEKTAVPYQTLLNALLRSCKEGGYRPKISWLKETS